MIASVGILIGSVGILIGSVGILIGSVGILIGSVGILIGSVGILIGSFWILNCRDYDCRDFDCRDFDTNPLEQALKAAELWEPLWSGGKVEIAPEQGISPPHCKPSPKVDPPDSPKWPLEPLIFR